jgi:hypothetical protein
MLKLSPVTGSIPRTPRSSKASLIFTTSTSGRLASCSLTHTYAILSALRKACRWPDTCIATLQIDEFRTLHPPRG